MTSRLLAATTAVALAAFAVPAHANLIANGSFEGTTLANKGSFAGNVTSWGGGSGLTFLDFPGTADNGTYLSVYGPFPKTSPDGGNFVEADGDPIYAHAITQTVAGLTAGQSYSLSFYQAAGQQVNFTGPTTERWSVSLGGTTQLSSLYSLPQGGVGPWEQQTMSFVANSTSELLSFLAVGTPNGAPPISFLDGVSLNASTTSVPEPAALALVGVGLLGLFAVRRRKRD